MTPRTIGSLLAQHIFSGLVGSFVVFTAEKSHEQDVFGFEDGVALQFAAPMAVGALQFEQTAARALLGAAHGRQGYGGAIASAVRAPSHRQGMYGVHGSPFRRAGDDPIGGGCTLPRRRKLFQEEEMQEMSLYKGEPPRSPGSRVRSPGALFQSSSGLQPPMVRL